MEEGIGERASQANDAERLADEFEALQREHFAEARHWSDIMRGCDVLGAGEPATKLALVLSGISSGLHVNSRVHIYAMGKSQGGKSYLQRRIGEHLFGRKFELVNASSAKSIYYECKEPNQSLLKGTVRMYDEFADQGEEMQNQVKAMTSRGADRIVLKTVDQQRNFHSVEVVGLPVVWTNSALPMQNPGSEQILNRFVKLNIDERPAQDDAIQAYQVDEETLGPAEERFEVDLVTARSRIADSIGRGEFDVRNPIASCIKMTHPEYRALRPMLSGLIGAFALGNRYLRPRMGKRREVVLASLSDNIAACVTWGSFEAYQLRPCPARYLRLLGLMSFGRPYTKNELSALWSEKFPSEHPLAPESCYTYMRELEKFDLVGSERRDGSREYEYRTLRMADGMRHPEYDSRGSLTKVYFGSLEFAIPKPEELAHEVERLERSSLTKVEGVVADLLDFDFIPKLFRELDLAPFSLTGKSEGMSSGSLLDFVRLENPGDAA